MKRINGRQTAYVNKLEGRSGSLWEGRYKASPIQMEGYLLRCCRYVELNPVRAGLVAKPEEYSWSSCQERVMSKEGSMLDQDFIFNGFGKTDQERIFHYKAFMDEGVPMAEKKLINESVNRNQLTGNHRFIDEIERRVGIRIERRGRGRPANEEK